MTYANGNYVMTMLNGKKINLLFMLSPSNFKTADGSTFVTANGEIFCVAEA